jgi:hypothetical protein
MKCDNNQESERQPEEERQKNQNVAIFTQITYSITWPHDARSLRSWVNQDGQNLYPSQNHNTHYSVRMYKNPPTGSYSKLAASTLHTTYFCKIHFNVILSKDEDKMRAVIRKLFQKDLSK